MLRFIVLIAFVSAAAAISTPVRECGAGIRMPTNVYFGGRDNFCTAEPCQVVRGSDGYTEVDFVVPFDTNTVTPQVKAKVFGITIEYDLPKEVIADGCSHVLVKGTCPLKTGEEAIYGLSLPVDPSTPSVSTEMQFTLFGDNKNIIFCYKLSTNVV